MPQASNELRARWGGFQGVGEDKAEAFLTDHGFILTDHWSWISPKPEVEVTEDEWSAMDFLVYEWDYGWLADMNEVAEFAAGDIRGRNL